MKSLLTIVMACVISASISQLMNAFTLSETYPGAFRVRPHEWDTITVYGCYSFNNFKTDTDIVLKRPIYRIDDPITRGVIDSFTRLYPNYEYFFVKSGIYPSYYVISSQLETRFKFDTDSIWAVYPLRGAHMKNPGVIYLYGLSDSILMPLGFSKTADSVYIHLVPMMPIAIERKTYHLYIRERENRNSPFIFAIPGFTLEDLSHDDLFRWVFTRDSTTVSEGNTLKRRR